MYKHLLVPVDGSELAERAMQAGIDLALQLGASITGFVVGPLPSMSRRLRARLPDAEDAAEPEAMTESAARQLLARFEQRARDAGVAFEGFYLPARHIDRAIIDAAESRQCDLVVMVTHGRGAFGEFLYGSQTKAVLAGSKMPLLVLK